MTYSDPKPLVGIIMGSQSDWETMKHAHDILHSFKVPHEVKIVSAHRTPDRMNEYAKSAQKRGLQVIIAGAGGAAHLPGMAAAFTTLPVLGVPVESRALKGLDALLAISILALQDGELRAEWEAFRENQTSTVLKAKLPAVRK